MPDPVNPPLSPREKPAALESGTYEVLRNRLDTQARELKSRLQKLNDARQQVFGAIRTALIATDRITTANNCVPRDMVSVGKNRFLFAYNVFIGLRSETHISDVFAAYEYRDHAFHEIPLDLIANNDFEDDFKTLYKYYRNTIFVKFSIIGPHLFMVFRVGQNVSDIKTFKWLLSDGQLLYRGNRSDHEFAFPPQHEFEWSRTHRDLHRSGKFPHISIEDRLFVETIGGDLTIKVEDNTASGGGIYSEPVDHKDQTLDDAEIFYSSVGHLILLKIRPYQEKNFRHFVYNEKLKEVCRIDAIADSCVLLPKDQGIIFSNGYYLQLGEFKQFPSQLSNMLFERRVQSPNGEDFLHVFYNRLSGTYILMSYNIIEQKVESPILCHGFSIFENGELAYSKAEEEPQKHHAIQIWQTPYLDANLPPPAQKDSFLFKLGNPAIVRCMAECHEILTLLNKEESFAALYIDIVKAAGDIVDSYFWLDRPEAFQLKEVLLAIKEAATSAIDEYEKVLRLKRNTQDQINRVAAKTRELIDAIHFSPFEQISDFVHRLADLRSVRGEIISLKDLRYTDLPLVEKMEAEVAQHSEDLSNRCVEFLLQPEALEPYRQQVTAHESAVEHLAKVTEAKSLEEAVNTTARELDLLIEIVGNLKIEDSTQTTRIIDNISAIYAPLNQIKAALRRRRQDLQKVEGEAQFNSQMRLLDQSVTNYLEVSDTPERCDEHLTRIMVQVEELESRFAEFDDFIPQLSEKRNELYSAFETRKLSLVEARNKRASALFTAAERILKGIQHRVESFDSINDINGYFASDLMVDRVRDVIQQLLALNDSVKAGDLQTKLKTIREDAVRQLKDRQELFVDGRHIIQFGKHKFAVNTQDLELTMVPRDGEMFFHLTGTNFFERVTDPDFLSTRALWSQELISENPQVYRAEYLAYQILKTLESRQTDPSITRAAAFTPAERLAFVQQFMAPRYTEGYVKGIHDLDAARILEALLRMHTSIGLLRYHTRSRACATVFWTHHKEHDPVLAAKLDAFRLRNQLFPGQETQACYIRELQGRIGEFIQSTDLFPAETAAEAGEYLFYDLTNNPHFVISPEAARVTRDFQAHLRSKQFLKKFEAARKTVSSDPRSSYQLVRDWLQGFLAEQNGAAPRDYLDEAAALLFRSGASEAAIDPLHVIDASVTAEISGMNGAHPLLQDQVYALNYNAFMLKLQHYGREVVPAFEKSHHLKSALLERLRDSMRLDEFRPRVLTSFVRNQLINSIYLPLIGDNLAKQMGVAGENTRTDRSGLLLLVSPPGYGKTTLMEYVANRLGIIFMKINGPAIGYQVTSLDPAEARNASAREEIEKLNLALEMGDNIMLYLDDIQHCHPELLQKFISLCDAQRKIEGVYKGRARTYDLRGRKVAVVMAGNPYTESGDKFQIPDMLANRADTYNLGDIIGNSEEAFKASYLENALTSNPVLSKLAARGQKDVQAVIKMAGTDSREGLTFESTYSAEDLNEFVAVMKKLLRIRDILLRVNLEYIRSAAQADAYRTEPPFKLQGSYRNMNRLAEKVLPIMNDEEIASLIQDHYQNEAQTLTTGAEANLLKFKELFESLTPEEARRWDEIKRTFQRNLLFQGVNQRDPVGQVVAQLSVFSKNLEAIKDVLSEGIQKQQPQTPVHSRQTPEPSPVSEHVAALAKNLEGIKDALSEAVRAGMDRTAPTSGADGDGTREIAKQLAGFAVSLDSLKPLLEEQLKKQREQATFRLIDPSSQADYQITSVNQETLRKIWALVEEDRARTPSSPSIPPPESAAQKD